MSERSARTIGTLLSLLVLFVTLTAASTALAGPEGRTRNVCRYVVDPPRTCSIPNPFGGCLVWLDPPPVTLYDGHDIACGGHLQPACTSGATCDAGFSSYSEDPFPYTYDCPSPVPSSANPRFNSGCYDVRPDCNDCGGDNQPPCPPEAEPWCTQGCDGELTVDELTGLCGDVGGPGYPCGPGYECAEGLECDPFSGFVCVEKAQAGESCANPFVVCGDGLQCTLALECSHAPYALEGETCDVTAHCGDGLHCQAGIPQRCERDRRPGEGCSAFNPCMEGASCLACTADFCDYPLQCFWSEGPMSVNQCEAAHVSGLADFAQGLDEAVTVSMGEEVTNGMALSISVGQVYGPNGEYGCFVTQCEGIAFDAGVEAFASLGRYDSYYAVAGDGYLTGEPWIPSLSTSWWTEVQVPGSVFNFMEAYVGAPSSNPLIPGPRIGMEQAFSVGVSGNPLPFAAGAYDCTTWIDTIDDGFGGGIVPPVIEDPDERPGNLLTNGDFDIDLSDWGCEGEGACGWITDDPLASSLSGSGIVDSPELGVPSDSATLRSACIMVEEGETFEFGAWLKTVGAEPGRLRARWYGDIDCNGGEIAIEELGQTAPDLVWREMAGSLIAPPGAQGLALEATASRHPGSGDGSSTQLDLVYLPEPSLLSSMFAGIVVLVGLRRRHSVR